MNNPPPARNWNSAVVVAIRTEKPTPMSSRQAMINGCGFVTSLLALIMTLSLFSASH